MTRAEEALAGAYGAHNAHVAASRKMDDSLTNVFREIKALDAQVARMREFIDSVCRNCPSHQTIDDFLASDGGDA